jgi:hypothetical protein
MSPHTRPNINTLSNLHHAQAQYSHLLLQKNTKVPYHFRCLALLSLLFVARFAHSQDLDPRAYVRLPVKSTLVGAGFGFSEGGVLTDPSSPLQDLHATLFAPSVFGGYVFNNFGKTAQLSAALPFAWGEATATVGGVPASVTRTGFGDMRLRYSILLAGGNAATLPELMQSKPKTIIGASLSMVAPTGQYLTGKLINLGTYRWSFKPEIALSHPFAKRWLVDVYAGVWFFTKNDRFYPGDATRTQKPLGSFQAHLSYNFTPRMWAALNTTFYTGGNTSLNGVDANDRQSNSRIGATFVFPIGKRHGIKTAYSRGAIIRSGADFTSISIGWQMLL